MATQPKEGVTTTQYMIVTPTGVVSRCFEAHDYALALKRFREIAPESWRLIQVTTERYDITPADHKGVLHLHMAQKVG